MTSVKLDLDAADLRISRGSVPASTQLAEALKAQIIQQRLPRGGRLPSERELIDRSGLSRVTVRAAVGMLQRQGWLVRRQGLGTFVADPVEQELSCGVRTITEVLLSCGVTPQVDVLSHQTGPAPQRISETLGLVEVLCIRRRIRTGDQPLALVTAYLPPGVGPAVEPLLSGSADTETTYAMWERRLRLHVHLEISPAYRDVFTIRVSPAYFFPATDHTRLAEIVNAWNLQNHEVTAIVHGSSDPHRIGVAAERSLIRDRIRFDDFATFVDNAVSAATELFGQLTAAGLPPTATPPLLRDAG